MDTSTVKANHHHEQAFEALVEHWAKERLDGPMQVVARFDEAAKQLITLGGLLQGVFFAILALGDVQKSLPLWVIPLFFVPLVVLVFCAAMVVCTVPLQMEAINTYELLRKSTESQGLPDEILTKAVEDWCVTIDGIAITKHKWLYKANILFLVSSVLILFLLLPFTMM